MPVGSAKSLQMALAQDGAPQRGLVRDLDANVERINEIVGFGKSFDVILRRMRVAGVDVAIYVINGFMQTLDNVEVLREIAAVATVPQAGEGGCRPPVGVLRALLQEKLAYSQVTVVTDLHEAVQQLLVGPMIMLVDGEAAAIVVDTRVYPDRSPSAPEIEQVIHGPQDGFVENIIFNTALVRRRVQQPALRVEMLRIGRRGKTYVAVAYIEDLTDPALVAGVKQRLRSASIDAIPMAEEPVAEILSGQPWNPFPTTRMTERPDVAANELLEGHVVVLVDTTPVALSVPVSFFQLLQHPEDYHVSPIFGTYLRWVEFIGMGLAVVVPPVWLLLATHPALLGGLPALSFIGPKSPPKIPLPLQFLLAEVAVDILRRAILNSPSGLASTFGILGAVVFGDLATKVGLFTPEALIYMVAAAIASFAISNVELAMTARIIRMSLLLLEWLWALPGVVIGLLFWFVLAARTDSLGKPYLWPLIPFNWAAMRSVLIREPLLREAPRPSLLRPRDRWREAR